MNDWPDDSTSKKVAITPEATRAPQKTSPRLVDLNTFMTEFYNCFLEMESKMEMERELEMLELKRKLDKKRNERYARIGIHAENHKTNFQYVCNTQSIVFSKTKTSKTKRSKIQCRLMKQSLKQPRPRRWK
jgi:hypothetical protein